MRPSFYGVWVRQALYYNPRRREAELCGLTEVLAVDDGASERPFRAMCVELGCRVE